ncbi:MAG: T9SS type A sorting domain-containing protein [Luteibaculum sp.]
MSVDLEGLTGLQEYEEFTWSLFPNPSSGIIHLKTAFPAGRKNFKIFTLLDKEVYESSLIKESRVDLSFLDPGIYLFQWVDEKQQAQGSAQKFVLQ